MGFGYARCRHWPYKAAVIPFRNMMLDRPELINNIPGKEIGETNIRAARDR